MWFSIFFPFFKKKVELGEGGRSNLENYECKEVTPKRSGKICGWGKKKTKRRKKKKRRREN